MRDWLPKEVQLRQKLIRLIESHYQLYGFQPIDTPVMENIEVLQGKGGGENEKLMFKIEKRGDELRTVINEAFKKFNESARTADGGNENVENPNGSSAADSTTADEVGEFKRSPTYLDWELGLQKDLVDMGLRFDLTVPLARYYANQIGRA